MLFPTWRHISSPSELELHWKDNTSFVYCVILRGHKIPRILGTDHQAILYIGYRAHIRRALFEFIRCSSNGSQGHKAGQTLHYFKTISPGIAALFGDGSTAPHLEFLLLEGSLDAWLSALMEYLRVFGELPPLNGSIEAWRRPELQAALEEQWTFIKDLSELPTGFHPAIYRVHLYLSGIDRWLGTDPNSIIDIGKAKDLKTRLLDFILSAQTGTRDHTEGQRFYLFRKAAPGLSKLIKRPVPECFYYSYRPVDEKDLFSEENFSTDNYTCGLGELPLTNGSITGGRKWVEELPKNT